MTTWESARSPSPLRPPTGRPRSFASGLRVTSPSPRSHFVSSANDFDESSCCDETYVSQLSTRSDSRDHTSAETAGRFNDAMSPSRSILEKLKNDMNSLEMLRQTEFFEDDSENRHYNGGRVGRDFSSPKQNHQPVSSYPRSVDVTFRDSDSRGDSFASRRSLRSEKSWRLEKKSEETERALGQDAETDKLLMKVKILEEENERWQNSVSVLREDYVNNTRKLKEELQEAKTCEVELKKELLKAKAASEKEKQQIAENLAAATERHESELRSLCDKLRSAEETEKVLQDKIGSLELAIDGEGGLELLLQESKAENKKLQETIFLLDSELDGLRDIIDDTNQHNDEFKKALEHALEEKHQISLQLRDSENALSKALREHIAIEKLLEESRDESDEAKRALEDALDEKNRLLSELSDAENSHSQTKEAKDIIENLVKEITEESQRYRRDLEQATQENDAIKQLMSEEKNKAEEVRKNLEKKLTDYEAEINDLNVKSKEAKKNTEEQLSKAREAFAYEKETLNITLVSLEKEKEQCTSELQRLSHELAELNSQDVKATTELKISFEKHQKTKLELTKATDEVNNLRAKLSQKSDELIECSRQLSQSISEAEATKKQLKQAKEEKDQQENSIQELMGMTDTLKKKIDEVNAQAGNYKSKMDHYETQLKKSNATVNGSENKSKMLNEEITSLQTELSRLTEMIELAKNEKVGMQQSNNSICEKNNKLILENKELEQKLKQAEKETHSYKEQLTSALTSLDEMMKYIETSREEHDDIIQTLEGDLSKALDMKHATENKMNRLFDDMKKENDAMKENLIKQAESSSEEYGRTIAELETAKKQKASEAASLKYKIQMLEAEIDQLKKETDERKSNDSKQREAYEVKLEKEKIDRAKLEEETRLVVEKLRVTERENAELKEYLEEARMRECHDVEHKEQGNKIAELNASLQEKAAETTALQDEIKMLQAEVDKLSQSRNEEAEERKLYESEWARQQEEYEAKLEEEKQKAAETTALQDEIKMLQAEVDKLSQSRNEEAKERKLYESEWARQQEEYEAKLEEEKQLTMNKLSAAEKENAELKKSLEELGRKETQLAELKETLKQKTKNEIQLRGELAHKKQQMAISESNEKHLEEHVASLEAQIDQLISDYESKLEEMSETVM